MMETTFSPVFGTVLGLGLGLWINYGLIYQPEDDPAVELDSKAEVGLTTVHLPAFGLELHVLQGV
ncbi:MAG: hypothetical protein QF569_11255 [Candidatus Poribacteria bacterium]|jgi:hypothetical protein|nr:hypothetical protein [Candidatus Poribacteria bacterium]